MVLAAVFVGTMAYAQGLTSADRSSLDEPPTGYVNGLFTVNEWGTQVYFSQGNLQYVDGEWRFAEHQWDYLGDNGQGSETEDVARDLFGWNASGEADWGDNAIANGGGVAGLWRAPAREEWDYVFNMRTTTSGIRFAKAKVNGVNGVILLPDDWMESYHALNNANTGRGRYRENVVTVTEWASDFEAHGAVFLPAAGYRFGTRLWYPGKRGSYCSSTASGSFHAWDLTFDETHVREGKAVTLRGHGLSVRLVTTATSLWYTSVTTGEVTDITSNSATASGTVTTEGGTVITATGVCWNTDPDTDPTIDGDHSDEGALTGEFTSALANLQRNTTYYVRAYATDGEGDTMYGEVVAFTTLAELPAVTTAEVADIAITTATAGGEVTDDGGTEVTGCGVCWGTDPNTELTVEGAHVAAATPGTGAFTVALTGLTQNTTYYVCAYVTNSVGTVYGETVSFTTLRQPWVITATAEPTGGGTVTGANTYYQGDQCTLTATPATGYTFTKWTKDGTDYSTDATISFTVTAAASFVAVFTLNTYNVSATVDPTDCGSVSGTGTYNHGATCTLVATPADGYAFAYWTENGSVVSTDASYAFEVTAAHALVANFKLAGIVSYSAFSVREGYQVLFSQGNLQYQGSTNTWQFAENQYDYVGSDNSNISSTNSGWIDLFGWGTSGYNHGANCYQPWSTSTTYSDYYAYDINNYNLNDSTGKADWGYNAISNGGDTENSGWRTLTKAEWVYLFNTRGGENQIRYAKACVNNVNGVILLPDDWSADYYSLDNANIANANYSANQIDSTQWNTLEQHGAVFLPAAGFRSGTSVYNFGSFGFYWSASYNGSSSAWYVGVGDGILSAAHDGNRSNGLSVRLVRPAEDYSFTITASANPTEYGTVSGGGEYAEGAECTLTATANEGYVFVNWTETIGDDNPKVVSTSATYTFRVQDNRTLVANFELDGPQGALKGAFSVREGYQVLFSQGNLQYIGSAATPYWQFAEHQWDYLGTTTNQNSDVQNVDRDLFGWGTSGYSHGAVCYQPWSTSQTNSEYHAYGSGSYNLNDQTGMADWGYNAISNGGNMENSGWRTLTHEEWDYVFNTRSTSSGIRYAKAQVNGVNGVILLPDDWETSYYTLSRPNTSDGNAEFSSNIINETEWATLEQHGVVFLPAAGYRDGTSVNNVGSYGYYWSASYLLSYVAYGVYFQNFYFSAGDFRYRPNGLSVRLVRAAQDYSFTIEATPNSEEYGTVSGGGEYAEGAECTLTATANEGYVFVNWTETIGDNNPKVVSTSAIYTFRVQDNRTLVANFEVVPIPTGAINGKFSVNFAGDQVYFSKGNLQYIGSAGNGDENNTGAYWQFAENQWDCFGTTTGQNSDAKNVDRDLFGWGTSGWNNGNTYYQPWSTGSTSNSDQGYGYGPTNGTSCEYNLTGAFANADWGVHNAISNGGNTENSGWRTLTHEEWAYLFNTRGGEDQIRYAKACVNGINGVILLPDDWSTSYYSLYSTNINTANFISNTISADNWATLEQHGAVFLPAAGYRYGASVYSVGYYGYYWSASCYSSNGAWDVSFYDSHLYAGYVNSRYFGQSVRLVRSVQ